MVSNRAKLSQGFTLIEVLLAIAIFAVISLASFSIFDGVIKSERSSQEKMQRLNDVQRAWLVIERDFLQIAQRSIRIEGEAPQTSFIHTYDETFASNSQAIAFVRSGWTNPGLLIPRADVQSVAYRLQDEVLERLHYNFVDPVVGEQPKIRPLVTGVTELELRYFYNNKWNQKLTANTIPKAIEFAFETEDLGRLARKFLVADSILPSNNNSENNDQAGNGQNNGQSNSPASGQLNGEQK